MTRPLPWIWLTAMIIAFLCVARIFMLSDPYSSKLADQPSLVLIGSSLTGVAIPAELPVADLVSRSEFSGTVAVLWLGARSEMETIDAMHATMANGAKLLIVELNPFFTYQRSPPDLGWVSPTQSLSRLLGLQLARLRRWTDEQPKPFDDKTMDREYDGAPDKLRPMRFHDINVGAELATVLAAARRKNVRVVFALYPRSNTAGNYRGASFNTNLARAFSSFAGQYNTLAWSPGLSWPDDHFVDQGHLNRRGSNRFINELKTFLGTLP